MICVKKLSTSTDNWASFSKNFFSCAPGSYADIKDHWAHSPSGYYTIATSNGDTTTVYCHMKELRKSEGA